MTVTALTAELLDEGLKTRGFPGIVYRDGPTGRRAAPSGGPDVWEIIRAVKGWPERGEQAVLGVAKSAGLAPDMVRLAVEFYATFPDEIDARIALDERAKEEIRTAVERREKLLFA